MANVSDEGNVGFDGFGNHLRAPQADFLLNGINDVKRKRQFDVIFLQKPRNFGNAEATNPIIERTTTIKTVVEFYQFVFVSDDATNVDAHFDNLVLVFCAYVNENIAQFGYQISVFSLPNVNGGPTKNTFDDAFSGVNIDSFGRRNHLVRTTISDDGNKAIVGNVVHEPRNFVSVSFNNHPIRLSGIDDAISSAVIIEVPFVHERTNVVEPKFLSGGFKTRWRCVVEILK